MAMLDMILNIQAKAGWPIGRVCQLFDNLKQKYIPMSKLLRVQSIKKPNEIKHKEGEDPKVMYDKIEALRGNYPDQAKTLDKS